MDRKTHGGSYFPGAILIRPLRPGRQQHRQLISDLKTAAFSMIEIGHDLVSTSEIYLNLPCTER
eukprot:4037798-Pleurochrysis_carterae.AAC.6